MSRESILAAISGTRLPAIHRAQTHRKPWPAFDAFDRARYPVELREKAAHEWKRRAHFEYGSVRTFSDLLQTVSRLGLPLSIAGALSRLITDEVRHADLCLQMAGALLGEPAYAEGAEFPYPTAPVEREEALAWCADIILSSCCLGETVSRPMYDALVIRCTDPIPTAVLKQIGRDEQLHARFGWETLSVLLECLTREHREWLERRLRHHLAACEAACARHHSLEDLVGREHTIGPSTMPNLGTLEPVDFAVIFYSCIEQEIIPELDKLGLGGLAAWAERSPE